MFKIIQLDPYHGERNVFPEDYDSAEEAEMFATEYIEIDKSNGERNSYVIVEDDSDS